MILPRASTHLNPALFTVSCFVHLWEILKRFRSKSQSTDYWRHYKEVIARRYFENDANAAISISWLNQFTKQQRTYGHIQVASVYNSYTAQNTDNVYNMYKIMMMTTTMILLVKYNKWQTQMLRKKKKKIRRKNSLQSAQHSRHGYCCSFCCWVSPRADFIGLPLDSGSI